MFVIQEYFDKLGLKDSNIQELFAIQWIFYILLTSSSILLDFKVIFQYAIQLTENNNYV